MKIYTSRYSNPELKTGKYTVVGITRGLPKFSLGYELAGNIADFGPPGWLFHENDRTIFAPKYFEYMDGLGIERVKQMLSRYKLQGKDIVLCCYEDVRKPNEWCHRLVFAEWFERKTGYRIDELQDTSGSPKEKDEPKYVQASIFDL